MNLKDIGGKGISVASLLHLCSKNATPDLHGVKEVAFQRRTQLNDALIEFGNVGYVI